LVASKSREENPVDDHGRWVRREAIVEASSSEVWEALTDEHLLSEWLADEAELDPVPGGRATFRFADGECRQGTVLAAEEERSLSFSWTRPGEMESVVELTIEPASAGTRIVVVERDPAAPALAGAEWTRRLDAFVEALSLVAA
jgi:uncharacterized protein YndB with AHSA1/START domain